MPATTTTRHDTATRTWLTIDEDGEVYLRWSTWFDSEDGDGTGDWQDDSRRLGNVLACFQSVPEMLYSQYDELLDGWLEHEEADRG